MIFRKIIILLFTSAPFLLAQSSILDNYIQMGLENNLALKQKEFSLQKSIAALDEARGLFMPSVGINARYTRAGGGRDISFPIGDLFNPIHQSLNSLMGVDAFPTNLENVSFKFLREKEHETKISVIQPIFQPAVLYNYKIKSNLTNVQKAERDAFARALIADIKTAYFNYMISTKLVDLAESTEAILDENLRVSNSLFNNDKATKDVVYRAQAELSKLLQQKEEANKDLEVARSYLNFLLNRPLDEHVDTMSTDFLKDKLFFDVKDAEDLAVKNREELHQLEYAREAADNNIGLSKSNYLPSLILAADYGFQGETYKFTPEQDFWNASLVLRWNLFNGFQDKAKVEQAEIDKKNIETRQMELNNKVRLQVREAYFNLQVALKSIKAANDRLNSAKKTFEIIDRKFREGIASQVEFIDARSTMTQAELNNIVTTYQYQIRIAQLERVTAVLSLSRN